MNNCVKFGLIAAGGALVTGVAIVGIKKAIKVANKKKEINYKEKVDAYKEAVKTDTVTEEVKAEAEEAKEEVKKIVKENLLSDCIAVGAATVAAFGIGYFGGCLYEMGLTYGYSAGKFEGVANFAGANEYCIENGLMNAKDLKPGYFTANAKDFVKGFADTETTYARCKLKDGFENVVDEIVNHAKEVCSSVAKSTKEVIA